MKIACRRKWKQILLKKNLRPKNSEEIFGDLKLFENQNLENYLKTGVWENYF